MIKGWFAIYLREILILKKRFLRLISSMSVSPLLYLVAFGYAMGKEIRIEGYTYIEFLIPGLIAMSSMTQSFAISSEINISRFYWHIFEEFQSAPISNMAYVLGEILAGITRAILSVIVIIILGAFFGIILHYNYMFWIGIILNSFIFSSLAVTTAMLVKSHADQSMLTSFIITPMAFLGGTFFPIDRLPLWSQQLLKILPLTHAAKIIRTAAFGGSMNSMFPFIILILLGIGLFFVAYLCVNKARD